MKINRVKIVESIIKFKVLIALIIFMQGCYSYKGVVSDHYDGTKFFNHEADLSEKDHMKWLMNMESVEWPEWIDDPAQPPPVDSVKNGELRVTYINHATVLIQTGGVNILTDPIWSKKAGPLSWLGAKRVRSPGVKIEDLPDIDIILISHDHYDHLDFPTIEKILEKNSPVILTGLGVNERLKCTGEEKIIGLDWWQDYNFSKNIKITFVPARHNSGRGIFDKNKTLWGGFVIESLSGKILFMGDTGYGEFFKDIKNKFSDFRLAILPIGSYEARWFMKYNHMNPEDSVKVHELLNVKQSMGIHFSTFNEHPEQTIDAHEIDLKAALEKYSVPESEFLILKFGEGKNILK